MHAKVLVSILLVSTLLGAGCLDNNAQSNEAGNIAKRGKSTLPNAQAQGYFATLPDGTQVDPSLLLDVPPLLGAQRFIGYSSFEPTLGIHPKTGAVFMSALDFKGPQNLPQPFVRKTADKGVTWTDVSPRLPTGGPNPPVSFDPFVISDPVTGRIYTSDLEALVCNWLSWSDDEGKSWLTQPMGCGLPYGVHDHQSIITGKARLAPATAYQNRMLYYCVNRIGDSSCSASHNGGITFGPLVPVMLGVDVERGGFCGGLHGHVKTDNAGRVFLPKSQCGQPHVGVSEDDGATWKVYRISPRGTRGGDHEVAIAADAADNVYAFWIGEDGLPRVSMSKDHGKIWTPERNVAAPGLTATDKPTIHASADGKVAFAYIGTNHPGGYAKNRAAADWAGATWNGYIGVMTDALSENPIVLTTTVNDPADPIAINQCGGGRCQGLYDFIDVEIDGEGRPWAALVDVCHEKCIADFAKDPKSARHEEARGFAGTLATGPALTKEGGALPVLPALPSQGVLKS